MIICCLEMGILPGIRESSSRDASRRVVVTCLCTGAHFYVTMIGKSAEE